MPTIRTETSAAAAAGWVESHSKTLRDEFAMAAIQMEHVQNYGAMTATDMAQRAYQIADAMLAARNE